MSVNEDLVLITETQTYLASGHWKVDSPLISAADLINLLGGVYARICAGKACPNEAEMVVTLIEMLCSLYD